MKEHSSEIKKALKRMRTHDFGTQRVGAESEYTAKSIVGGIDSILIDLQTLCSAPAKFLKKSTNSERSSINSNLANLLNHCKNLDLTSAATVLEQIKPLIRAYGVRDSDERRVAFEDHVDHLQRKALDLASEIERLRNTKSLVESELEVMKETIAEAQLATSKIDESSASIAQKLEESAQSSDQIESIKQDCEKSQAEISESKLDVDALQVSIEEFAKKIASREVQLENQEVRTNDYKTALDAFSNERIKLLGDANSLIESARVALGYKTAEGLSAAFTEKQNEAKSDKTTRSWIIAAAIFIAGAIGIGIWVTLSSGTTIELVIGRISLIPILIGGAWFSASQYIKQRNLAEEYAYKSVLVRSIVGFSDQISSSDSRGEDYSLYMQKVLAEIHMNPVRSRAENSISKKEVLEILKELRDPIVKIAETAVKSKI
ncbi:hypothetical protein [Pseudoxanthomonas winnipegensis]|uniref:Uncharacterized protein n=1 Tax=Pseudoxanthomonas winnipegensis TaxID=2480810 RepID=A0A4Q8LCS6_9GAMM|nr:hypothetical protein [Pseudoxanthomonas winnipegensis]RZZ83791.1 hypothetical protein EA662_14545 [Pseudoxanthomonas winnipegensis]TAA26456.1 hypothetical protein EA661_16140 [Pseudoxanthomonas winnipegensis]TBV73833.1 hypothetical protein EYC46_14245 [Pseudoxanthomonas winnipegensis]